MVAANVAAAPTSVAAMGVVTEEEVVAVVMDAGEPNPASPSMSSSDDVFLRFRARS